jgi:hypothetical protein
MSIKKEVDKLASVYSKLLREEVDVNGNINYDPSAGGGLPTGGDLNEPGLGNGGSVAMFPDENCEGLEPAGASSLEDSNVSMARSEIFKTVKSAQTLQKLLMGSVSELEPWMLSKITKAADYISSVASALEYDEFEKMSGEMESGLSEMGSPIVIKVKDMLAGEPIGVNEEVIKQAIFNIECLKEANKKN